MLSYEQFIALPLSEKIILAICRATEQAKIFSLYSGSTYVRDCAHFVDSVKEDSVELNQGTLPLGLGEYYFSPLEKKLYVRTMTAMNPKDVKISITYRFHFSNAPVILPYDLNSGEQVEFEARINSIGSIGQSLDNESTGIVLESASNISLMNNDGFFDEIFDTLIWENKQVDFYFWSPLIAISDAVKVFSGVVETKNFSTEAINFGVKDFVFKLRNQVNLGNFSEADGDILPAYLGKPKRRLYGQAKQMKCVSLDCTLSGFPLTGTISGAADSHLVTGAGTSFLDQLSPGDELIFTNNGTSRKLSIESITDDDELVVGSELEFSFLNQGSVIVKPKIPYRKKNRHWSVTGHKLRSPQAEITAVQSGNRLVVDDPTDLFPDDIVQVNDDFVTIRRIFGNLIVLNNTVTPLPNEGDFLIKKPVTKLYFGSKEMVIDRDWNESNATECKIIFDELAEFNIAAQKSLNANVTFTNGSRTISTTATLDLRTILKPRDWIRKDSILEATWYEILDVTQQEIILRVPFSGVTATTQALIKNVEYIDDNSLITVNCLGMEVDDSWIKNASNAVRHLILNDAEFESVDEDSFAKAADSCGFILSMPIPEEIGNESPQIRDVITKINESVFGSLYGNSALQIAYSILNATKPALAEIIDDSDILSWSASSNQQIANEISVNYRPFTDIFSGSQSVENKTYNSGMVDRLVGIKNTYEKMIYIYEDDKAEIVAQRLALFRSACSTIVAIKAKLNLSNKSVNDKMFISLDRLFKRFGGKDKRKIGTITSVKKDGYSVDLEFTDLGNVYNRVSTICPNATPDYVASSDNDRIQWGFIVDNDTLTPDNSNEEQLGNNLIG